MPFLSLLRSVLLPDGTGMKVCIQCAVSPKRGIDGDSIGGKNTGDRRF
jgi:hypothetical protein